MSPFQRFCIGLLGLSAMSLAMPSSAFAAKAFSAPGPISCTVRQTPPSPADQALMQGKVDDAVKLYATESSAPGPEGERARSEHIRLLLFQGDQAQAGTLAQAWFKGSPKDAWAQDAIANVDFRSAAIDKAGEEFRAAIEANFCNAQAHADYARYLAYTGFRASAKSQLDIAHKLDPVDSMVTGAWSEYQPRAVQAQELDAFLKHATFLKDDQRKLLEQEHTELSGPSPYPCQLVSDLRTVTIPFHAIHNGNATNGQRSNVEWGLEVKLGKASRRLEIDTGASGIILTRAAAASLGLTVEQHAQVSGIDAHLAPISIAKVHDITIGDLEFHDCAVQDVKVTRWDADVSMFEGMDGFIGADVFRNFLVTLDFPGHVMKLDPLPAIPGVTAPAETSIDTGVDTGTSVPVDRYIAPSMTSWTKVFRNDHDLLVPVRVNKGPTDLFLIDTGAGTQIISPEAAKRVGRFERGSASEIYGVSGEAQHVDTSGALTLDFAGLRQPVPTMDIIPLTQYSYPAEVSGILGQFTLHQLTLHIDYRDQLVKFSYDPSRIAHCMINVTIDDCY